MTHSTMLHVRVNPQLKSEASDKLASAGLTLSHAVRALLERLAHDDDLWNTIPLEPRACERWLQDQVGLALNGMRPFSDDARKPDRRDPCET